MGTDVAVGNIKIGTLGMRGSGRREFRRQRTENGTLENLKSQGTEERSEAGSRRLPRGLGSRAHRCAE